ncbi:MAG TPA: hypothetical protein PLS03_06520 [Terrimicrobiaceae bacterium]|nr:hypothetical protein [Terrimicrobiaceae bacterium]
MNTPAQFSRMLCILSLAALASGCSTLGIKVDSRAERLAQRKIRAVLAASSSSPAATALTLSQERNLPDSERIGRLIEAARLAARSGEIALYNSAVAQLVVIVREKNFQDLPPVLVVAPESERTLDPRTAGQLVPAAGIGIRGLLARSAQTGAGIPMVAWYDRESPVLAGQPGIPRAGLAVPVTAILTTEGGKSLLSFQKTLRSDHARIGGRNVRLAADFSAPIAVLLSHSRNRSIDVASLLFTDRNFDSAGLFQFQTYDPNKIPVIFVHGLMSRPEAWTQALNGLLADPKIRERYQFWFFLYPTGLPVWKSAAVLRREIDRYHLALDPRNQNPRMKRMVLIGHSMGGLISSLLIREGGPRLWGQFSDVSPREVGLSPRAMQEILDMIYFSPRNDVARTIFIATPHRGSNLAVNPFVDFAARLIRLPLNALMTERETILSAIREDSRDLFVAPANSLRFLRARSPLLLAILNLPLAPGMPYHSIIGDRGRGDTPKSSDGVVPYWSSHLEGAKSEKIVPSGHGANEDAKGIEEMRRILVENLSSR